MKFKTLAMMGLSTLLVTAVACTTTTTDDGTGGAGGEGGESTTTGTTTGVTTGTTVAATTSTGGPACDTGTTNTIDSTECDDCIGCALGDQCSDELATLQADPNFQAFLDCIEPCADDACFDACIAMYPDTADKYITTLSCAICVECPNNCDAATNCM